MRKKDPDLNRNVADSEPALVERFFSRILEDAGGELPLYEDPRSSEGGEWYQPSPWAYDEEA